MNQMKDTILLAGLGLIGGSIALAIKKNHPGKRIIGIDISDEQAVAALKLGVIDDRADSFISGVKEAATVIIATPVEQTLVMLEELAHSGIEHELLITDVGSTKQKVVDYADQVLPSRYQFVGGHPMAGSHKSGVAAAKEFLFENAFYILTPGQKTDKQAVEQLKNLLKGTNAILWKCRQRSMMALQA